MREALNVMGDGRYKDALDKLRLEVPLRPCAQSHLSRTLFVRARSLTAVLWWGLGACLALA